MSLNTTTLSAAIGASDTALTVASATGITAPNFQTGSGITYLYLESELMQVTAVSGTYISVIRGVFGTQAVSHSASVPVLAGLPADFPNFVAAQGASVQLNDRFAGISAPVAAAAALAPSGRVFHVTGTTASSSMKLPTNFVEGSVTIIADGTWTWTSSTNAQGFAQAGAVTSAGSCVTFIYDAATALWYSSRNS